ncbi:restriction endonuclease subunit S [Streptomyces sp. NBC_01231]|nr:restriction endonuclease subunit S [Streptomyces sp. NBC_01231]
MTTTVPLRRLVDVIDCAHVTAPFVDDDRRFPVASIRECQGAYVDLSHCKYTTQEFFDHLRASDRAPRTGDLLFIRNVSVGLVSAVAPGTPEFAVGQETVLLRRTSEVDPTFLRYALVGAEANYAVESAMIGSTFRRINVSAIRALPVALPPPEEQRVIANYLDRETAHIDTLIGEQQRLIEMLRDRRVATVAEALDGYEQTQLRRLVDHDRPMTYGILQCGEPVDGGVVYIGPSDILGEGVSPNRGALRTTAPEIAGAYKRSVLEGGDVVVSIGPAYGKVAVVSDDLAGANLTQDTVRVALRPDLVDTRFIVWALLSRQTAEYWDYQIMGATFRRLNLGTLARTPIPLPAIHEQRRIAAYLDEQTAKIDTLIAEAERFIELSRERRSALITAAVTGQIDVREVA